MENGRQRPGKGDRTMSGMFDTENKFVNLLAKVGDLILLSILWCLCTMSVLFAGLGWSTVYYVALKCVRSEYGTTFKETGAFLKGSWKQELVLGGITAVYLFGAFSAISFSNSLVQVSGISLVYAILARVLLIPPLLIVPWLFPLFARFTMKSAAFVKTALILSIRHFGKTVLALALLAAAAFCAANVPILLLILPGAVSLCLSYLIEPVFSQYIKKDAVFSAKDIWKISQE